MQGVTNDIWVALHIAASCIKLLSYGCSYGNKHSRVKMWAMKHVGGSHQYTPMIEYITYFAAIDTGNVAMTSC